MVKERIDDLVDILGEEFAKMENTFVIRNQQQLVKYMENPREWKQKQLLSRNSYRKELISLAKSQISLLNEKTEKVFLLSYQQVDEKNVVISEHEIEAKDIPEDIRRRIREMQEFNAKGVVQLANQSLRAYTKSVRIISQTTSQEELYDAIKNQMPKGIDNGIKVAYRNGAEVSWKSYMEMNVRTTIHQETTKMQMTAGAKVGQIFYIVDSFADCAPDHADYQGKVYYNAEAEIPDEVMRFIESNGIKSVQEVRDGKPYLSSRPNCRHEFHAIPLSEAMGKSEEEILKSEGFEHGEYKDSNYEATEQQRYIERQIRKWKLRATGGERLQRETGQDIADANFAKAKVRQWQARQRELIRENPKLLERRYDRENAKIMVDHLGVRYDYRVVDGRLVKK